MRGAREKKKIKTTTRQSGFSFVNGRRPGEDGNSPSATDVKWRARDRPVSLFFSFIYLCAFCSFSFYSVLFDVDISTNCALPRGPTMTAANRMQISLTTLDTTGRRRTNSPRVGRRLARCPWAKYRRDKCSPTETPPRAAEESRSELATGSRCSRLVARTRRPSSHTCICARFVPIRSRAHAVFAAREVCGLSVPSNRWFFSVEFIRFLFPRWSHVLTSFWIFKRYVVPTTMADSGRGARASPVSFPSPNQTKNRYPNPYLFLIIFSNYFYVFTVRKQQNYNWISVFYI